MRGRGWWRRGAKFSGILLMAVIGGCGPDPEKAGDACDPDDGCPGGLVCAPGGDEHICYYAPAGPCASAQPDLCLGDSVCGPSGVCETPLGGACDPASPDACVGDAVCIDGVCQLPAGAPCDPNGQDFCAGELVCGKDAEGKSFCGVPEGGTCDPALDLCVDLLVCAELAAGGHACFPPVFLGGNVFDAQTKAPIAGAHVLALDDQGSAISDVAVSGADGAYTLEIPVERQADGAPVTTMKLTLRADAADYQPFPSGLRTALPIATSEAKPVEPGWLIDTTLTDVALLALPGGVKGLPSLSGRVLATDGRQAGVLVVAEGTGVTGISAVSDLGGDYTIFNVPEGSYTVRGYAAGIQLEPTSANVAKSPLTGVDLAVSAAALGRISGNVNIVNAPGGSKTSVVLVVESTFSDTFVRGDVPRGLRAPLSGPPSVSGAFTIENVPAGRYVVLAAFENDLLVRDPDPNIAGTQIVTVDMPVPGQDVPLAASFKVTEALAVLGPGVDNPEGVTAPPTLRWDDDSSEDYYTVLVYNAYGDLVWCRDASRPACDAGGNVPKVNSGEVSVPYGGPMEAGMYYQFRATSWRTPGGNPGPISTTEDLRGVFFVAQP